jgi:hypothetical protein
MKTAITVSLIAASILASACGDRTGKNSSVINAVPSTANHNSYTAPPTSNLDPNTSVPAANGGRDAGNRVYVGNTNQGNVNGNSSTNR